MNPERFEVIKCRIVEIGSARRIFVITFRNDENHALACTCQQNPIGIFQIDLAFDFVDSIPTSALELVVRPTGSIEAKVAVPDYAGPVQFKPLHLKFCGDVFEVIRRPGIVFTIEKPFDRVGLYANIYGMRLKSLRLR